MFAGGRLHGRIADLGDTYSISLWLWNGMPADARDVSGWLFSRGHNHGLGAASDHVGVAGKGDHSGRLIFQHGNEAPRLAGSTEIPRWKWQHVVFVRDAKTVRLYLNGKLEIETRATAEFAGGIDDFFVGGRSDNQANWQGRLDEVVVFKRALDTHEIGTLAHVPADG